MVYDINPSGNSFPKSLCFLGNLLLFAADDGGTYGEELWKTDGTTTSLVQDIYTGSSGSAPNGMTAYNGYVYFTAASVTAGAELFRSNGNGATLVQDIYSGATWSLLRVMLSVILF